MHEPINRGLRSVGKGPAQVLLRGSEPRPPEEVSAERETRAVCHREHKPSRPSPDRQSRC